MDDEEYRKNVSKKMDLLMEAISLNNVTNTQEYSWWVVATHCVCLEFIKDIEGPAALKAQLSFLDLIDNSTAKLRKTIMEKAGARDEIPAIKIPSNPNDDY